MKHLVIHTTQNWILLQKLDLLIFILHIAFHSKLTPLLGLTLFKGFGMKYILALKCSKMISLIVLELNYTRYLSHLTRKEVKDHLEAFFQD